MLNRMVVVGCAVGASLALAAPALAKPSPSISHLRRADQYHAGSGRTSARKAPTNTGPGLYVNGTTGNNGTSTCRLSSHPCKTIAYALTQAPSGATIFVAAGTYPEQLTVSKNVTIKGTTTGKPAVAATIIEPNSVPSTDTDPDSSEPVESIVDFAPGVTAGNLTDVQVNGTAASSSLASGGCNQNYVGVYYHDASGTLTSDQITGEQLPAGLFGCQAPDGGVYAVTSPSSASPSTVTMSYVTVTAYQKNGITCDDAGTVCNISLSTVTGIGATGLTAQNGIQVYGAAGSIKNTTVTNNSYTSPDYTGPGTTYYTASGVLVYSAGNVTMSRDTVKSNDANVYLFGDDSAADQGTWSITGSVVSDATNDSGSAGGSVAVPFGDGYGDGIDLDGAVGVTVTGNTVMGDPEYGIGVFSSVNSSIGGSTTALGNKTGRGGKTATESPDGDGIYVGDPSFAGNQGQSTNNVIEDNAALSNTLDGILADANAVGNVFNTNTLQNNLRYDAEDLSTGGQTAGTANTWTSNSCKPGFDSSPEGLC